MRPTELGVPWWIYVGTTRDVGAGIHLFQMKTSENPDIPEFVTMAPLGLVAPAPAVSFIAIDARRALLFAVNELDRFEGKPSGAVSAFAVDRASGKLTPLGQRPSMGPRPCHLALAPGGKHLVVANDGGSVAVLPVATDGKLGAATDVRTHTGKSVHPRRQQGPHPQGVTFSPDGRSLFVCDLGLDQVIGYRFDPAVGKLAASTDIVRAKPGAGPRRLVFRPDGKFAYVANELDSTVTALGHDAGAGTLKPLQTLSTLPGYYDGPNRACEIGVHPSGKYLLVANAGHNSVVLFDIDASSGQLTYVEDQSTYGAMPVHFGMDTDGKHFAVANRDSGTLLILRAPESGRVKPGGNAVKVPSPACAAFLAAPSK
jgi:6-phosphogluconolactonase